MDLQVWKSAKTAKKLTLKQIAERSGLPLGSIQNIFAGYVKNPRIDTVEAIEAALGISNAPTDEEKAAGVVEHLTITVNAIESEMLDLFRELGRKRGEIAQNALIAMLEIML